jgi:membrane-associated protease RseP (regulator of RpoE activity)
VDPVFWLGLLLFLLGLLVSIALHELGHLVPAKAFGIKVTQYMVGFGTTVWSRRRGETEYGIKALPLGGYIRMIGMFPPAPGSDGTRVRQASTGPFQSLVEGLRHGGDDADGPCRHRVRDLGVGGVPRLRAVRPAQPRRGGRLPAR